MSEHSLDEVQPPDVSHLVTEDDTPVDSWFQEKQMRLLVEPLYSSWKPTGEAGKPRLFLAAADVGAFATAQPTTIVPDVLLALDVAVPDEFWRKEKRSYFLWELGKPPDVVIEVVSNREGDELRRKRTDYGRIGVPYYVVYDHLQLLGDERVHAFQKSGDLLTPLSVPRFESFGLQMVEWEGSFETKHARWLRWADLGGALVPTGQERAETEAQRAERYAARLRELGIEPDADS